MTNTIVILVALLVAICAEILAFRRAWTIRRAVLVVAIGLVYGITTSTLAWFDAIDAGTAALAWIPALFGMHAMYVVTSRFRDASQLLAERVMAQHIEHELGRENRSHLRIVKGGKGATRN